MATVTVQPPNTEAPRVEQAAKFRVERKQFLQEIALAHTVLETRTPIPILSCFVLRASEDPATHQGQVTILATDLDQSLQTTCAAADVEPGTATVSGRKLYDYLRLLDGQDVQFERADNFWVHLRSGRSRTKMVGQNAASFPAIRPFPEKVDARLPVHALRNLLARTSFAVDTSDSNQYMLHCLNMILTPDSITMVGTNAHHLAWATLPQKIEGVNRQNNYLLPLRSVRNLSSLLANAEEEFVDFAADDNTLYFRLGSERVYTVRKPAQGSFPNFEAVIPKTNHFTTVLAVKELLDALQRVSQFADEKSPSVRLALSANQVSLSSASAETGESEETLSTDYNGPDLAIKLNSSYLITALKIIAGGEVRLSLGGPDKAILAQPEGAEGGLGMKYVLMPMRTI